MSQRPQIGFCAVVDVQSIGTREAGQSHFGSFYSVRPGHALNRHKNNVTDGPEISAEPNE